MYKHTYVHTYIYIHTYVRTYKHIYICTYKHICIYTYIHTYIRKYIQTYINTYININNYRIFCHFLQLEESTEIIRLQVPSTHHQKGSNNSSTLPVRVKSRKRNMPAVIQVFNSVREKKGQKKRLAVTDDTFVHSYDRSESSGYLSQHSSYNSLLDHDSTGSVGSQDPRFLSCTSLPVQNGVLPNRLSQNSDETSVTNHSTSIPMSLSQPLAINGQQSDTYHKLNSIDVHTSSSVHSVNNGETRPKVLNRTKSSSKVDKHNWHNEPYSSTSDSNSPQSSGRDTVTPPLSKYPIRKGSLPIETNISPKHRKGSLQGSLTPTQLSPKVSPDIRRRVESITKQISSCNGHIPTSGVFSFPDPVEVLGPNWNPVSHIGRNKSMDDLSPEDFPPIDPQLVDQANHAYLNPTRSSNQLSSPQSPQRRISEGLQKSTRRPAPTPPQSRSRIHSQGSTPEQLSSPLMRRQSSSESSPITPKRKAPQPPNQKGSWTRASSSEDPLEVKTPVIEKRKLFSRQKSETETILVSQTKPETQDRNKTETQTRNMTETRDHTQSSEVQPKGPDRSGGKSKQKVAPVFNKQKSEEKRKKSANQILMSSGVNAGLSNDRSDLLVAIRKGIQLKNVKKEEQRKKQHSSAMPWDVAAILERRYALEISDNENEEGAVQDAEWEDL